MQENNQEFKITMLKDLGMRYITETSKRRTRFALCVCHCGKEFEANFQDIKNDRRKSCGCLNQRRKFKNKAESARHHKKLYRERHKEKIAKDLKEYYLKNKESILNRTKEYFKNNKELVLERNKEYSKTEMGKLIKKNIQYRRRTVFKNGDVTTNQLSEFINSCSKCYWCGKKINRDSLNVDHYIPISKGGLHTLSNLVHSCEHCNKVKNDKDPIIFAQSVGKLL